MFYYMVCWLFVLLFLVFVEFSRELVFSSNFDEFKEPEKTDSFQEYVIEVDCWERPPPGVSCFLSRK